MNKNMLLKIAVFIEKITEPSFRLSYEKQKMYLAGFSQPSNEIERSYFQYKCQMKQYGFLYHFFVNLASFPLVLFYLLKRSKEMKLVEGHAYTSVFFPDGKPHNILPCNYYDNSNIVFIDSIGSSFITKNDKKFLLKIFKRYPFSFYFILKIYIKIIKYRNALNNYSPKEIICCSEYSFTSSVLTEYCHLNGINHVNIMHGEKIYSISDSFFSFDKCYVWDDYYVDLFRQLKAVPDQFIVSLPASLQFYTAQKKTSQRDYVYYLANENKKTLDKIASVLEELSKTKKVAVRPHPRYSDLKYINKKFLFCEIEQPNAVKIEDSILKTKNAISLFSTVLFQAELNGVTPIIDDYSNIKKYRKLANLQYRGVMKYKRLSQIMNLKTNNSN